MARLQIPTRAAWLATLVLIAGCPLNETQDTSAEVRVLPKNERPGQANTSPTGIGENAVPAEFMQKVRSDLVQRSGTSADGIVVVRAEAVRFNDGSLGCPEPGNMYTQALVDGYWVVLESAGKQYDYRISDRGFLKLCTKGKPPASRDAVM